MTAVKNVTVGNVTVDGQRGRHTALRKIAGDKTWLIREHLQHLPRVFSHYSCATVFSHCNSATVFSHYSRAKSPHKKYMGSHLTIKRLRLVVAPGDGSREPWCGGCYISFFNKVFTKEFNITFQPPRTDTCSTCDKLSASICAPTDAQEKQIKQQLEEELHLHKDLCHHGQQLMKNLAKNKQGITEASALTGRLTDKSLAGVSLGRSLVFWTVFFFL